MTGGSLRSVLDEVATTLSKAGLASPRVDAELILAHVIGVRRSALPLIDRISSDDEVGVRALVAERSRGVPLQYLLGSAAFRHLELSVGPGVFIPRPETELILEIAADQLSRATVVVDLCAGSGAIALSVGHEFPGTRVVALERSPAAVRWLSRNAADRAAAGDRPIEIVVGDVGDPDLLPQLTGTVDVVLSNPPYVPEAVRGQLSVEVGHDPDDAVFAGPDGLALMPAVLAAAARLLRPGGRLVVEHDDSHRDLLARMLAEGGQFADIVDHRDLTGRSRFASASRAEA